MTGFFKKHKLLSIFLIVSVLGTSFVMMASDEETKTVYPEHSEYYVSDYSGVFSAEAESYIDARAKDLYEETGAQIVVVAVPNTHTESLETYSLSLANGWGIGSEEADNGLLILFTTEEPHVRLEVGTGLQGCLPDGKAGRILDDYAVDAKNNGRWNEAAVNTFVAAAQVVYNEYGLEPPEDVAFVESMEEGNGAGTMADMPFPEPEVVKNEDPFWYRCLYCFVAFWALAFVPFIVVWGLIRSYKNIGTGSGGGYSGGYSGGWSSGSSGGWSSGGSSGGGFSGGGGSFSGGGASR